MGEGQIASKFLGEWTGVGSLFGVDAQVIVEVVPLSELHIAALEVTFQHLKEPFCLRVFKPEHPVSSRLRDLSLQVLVLVVSGLLELFTLETSTGDDFNGAAV